MRYNEFGRDLHFISMSELDPFSEFVRRIRAGDGQAAEELVRQYESVIRREVRLHLDDHRIGRLLDSMDVCQSVLKSFFVRTAAGQYDLNDPSQLVGLLVTMARNKLASVSRREKRQRRDHRRSASDDAALALVPSADPGPSVAAEGRDLVEQLRGRLTNEERTLAHLRTELGLTWEEIASRVGGTAQAVRVQFSRAIDRIAVELNLDGDDDG
jgi:RNA polymerase sigma factor (sigma-70 family)